MFVLVVHRWFVSVAISVCGRDLKVLILLSPPPLYVYPPDPPLLFVGSGGWVVGH